MREKQRVLEDISAAVTRYYDSLTAEEIADDLAWGEFAALQFPAGDAQISRPRHDSR